MNKLVTVSAKIPEELYKELLLRVSEGERSDFIRNAIAEKLQHVPRPDRVLALENRVETLETQFSGIKKTLADLELLAFERGKVNPHEFCVDDLDHKLVDYLLHYKGATTPELAEYTKTNRWLVLNRLRRMQKTSKKQLGFPVIEFCGGEKSGKKKAWWLSKKLIEEP